MRGEKVLALKSWVLILGSPPLARGKVKICRIFSACPGITPACAGKRQDGVIIVRTVKDHPRLRGEKDFGTKSRALRRGSPPLARGKDSLPLRWYNISGITPACAGKSGQAAVCERPRRDHPRLRGEKPPASAASIARAGSPPLARGKAQLQPSARCWIRITPACAGKSCWTPHNSSIYQDHPRLRGEK